MRKFTILWPAAILLFLAAAAHSQSLGDLADKEKQRREEIKNDKVITDEEAAKYKSEPTKGPSASTKPVPEASKPKTGGEDASSKPAFKTDPDEPVDFQGRPESYWRQTLTEARQKIKDLENEGNVLVLRRNGLQDQFYKEADGYKRENIQRDIQKTIYEQDLNKENLAKARNALQDLENEARKSGALPGWIEAPSR